MNRPLPPIVSSAAPDIPIFRRRGDASEGYALLPRHVGEELAQDLPGLFGSDGVAALVPA